VTRHPVPSRLFVFLLMLPAPAWAEAGPPETHRLSVMLHGMHSTYAEEPPHRGGWGGGGSLRYAVSHTLKIRAGAEYVRTAHKDYPIVATVTPWTLGLEFGPRTPHRVEAFGRLGFGFYRIEERGTIELSPGLLYPFAAHDEFGGVHYGAGAHVKLASRELVEVGITWHKIFGVTSSDIPSLGTATLLNLQAGLGYTFP
jgi:opacity protein-like surface antigen